MSETRLGINITASNSASTAIAAVSAQIKALEGHLKALTTGSAEFQRLNASTAASLQAEIAALRGTSGALDSTAAATTRAVSANERLKASFVSQATLRSISADLDIQAAVYRRLGTEAGKYAATKAAQAKTIAAITAAETASQRRAYKEQMAAQKEAETFRFRVIQGIAPSSSIAGHDKQVRDSLRGAEQEGRAAQAFRFNMQQALAPKSSVAAHAKELEQVGRGARRAAEGTAILQRESKHLVSAFDELASGRRGQFFATLGSSIRDAGLGSTPLIASIGVLGGVLATTAIVRGAEHMGQWAEKTKAAAAAAGTALPQFSQLQGALELTGAKGESANTALRHFADNVGKAMANSKGIQAQAFNAIGISMDELRQKSQNLPELFKRVADALGGFSDGANKARAAEEIFGQGLATVEPLLNTSGQQIQDLMNKARELGITLDSQTAKSLIETGNKASTLAAIIKGEAIKAFVEWGPAIQDVIGFLGTLDKALNTVVGAVQRAGTAIHDFMAAVGRGMAMGEGFGMVDTITGGPGKSPFERGGREGMSEMSTTLPDVAVIGQPKPKAGRKPRVDHGPDKAAFAEYKSNITELREQLSSLRRDHELNDQMLEAQSAAARTVDYGAGPTGRFKRAQSEYAAFKSVQEQKLQALKQFQSQSDSIYDQIAAAATKEYAVGGAKYNIASQAEKSAQIWGQDSAAYKKAVGDKIAADKEFAIQHQRIENEIQSHVQTVIDAHTAAVEEVTKKWGSAFDKIGDDIENSITDAIKSAFRPMKPEYWYSSIRGPHGAALTQSHRISPSTQIFEKLGTSVATELGHTLQSTLTESLAKSLSGGTASSLGGLLAKSIGLGTPGGLFGSGIGAVAGVDQAATQAAFSASVATFTAAVGTFAAAAGTSAVGGVGAAAGAAGGLAGVGKFVGGLLPFGFKSGGVVPSAAGGWALGSFPGATPALLHSREMVLPSHISEGLQGMIGSGKSPGGDMHMHFHGPADAPSIAKWFKDNVQANSGAIKAMFRNNSLTPRSI
jgi:hypothetical protein